MKITLSEFESCLENVSFPLAVAVSGGADSLALLLLTHKIAQQKRERIIALTVDHGLRPESKDEALRVQTWAQTRGIEHVILTWEGEKPLTRLQEKARETRYHLLVNWCQNNHISTLLLGHHQQDQEETFWLRLSAGSGLDGLTGMKRQSLREGITFLRPLLSFPKERLKATLCAENQSWIEDPSNESTQFFRGRWRGLLAEEGLSSGRLSKVMEKLQEDASFIHEALQKALESMVQIHEEGYITLQKEGFENLHVALAKRMLSFLIHWFGKATYPPRSLQVERVLEKIKAQNPFTVGGIYWVSSQDKILLLREGAKLKESLPLYHLQEETLWDHRFWVDPALKKIVSRETILAPLGSVPFLKKEVKAAFSHRVWPTLPALWEKGKLVSVPHLGYNNEEYEMDLRKFINIKPLFYDSLRFTI